MTKTNHLILQFLFCTMTLCAQNTEKLQLQIMPENAFVKIDKKIYDLSKQPNIFSINLAPGKYKIEIWALEFESFKETIEVKAGEKNIYRKAIQEMTPEFVEFRKELKAFDRRQLRVYTGSAIFHTAYAFALIDIIKINKLKNDAIIIDQRRDIYERAFTTADLNRLGAEYTTLTNEYNRQKENLRKRRMIGGAVACVTVASTFYFAKKDRSKRKRPVFKADNPLTLQSINLDSDVYSDIALSLKFNF